jgi:gamma-glutamylputrescine oxidase
MILQNWWYTSLLQTDSNLCKPLKEDIKCDYLIIGGGMAGLHAALQLSEKSNKVVLLERNICGGSSTGKSAGFLTPDSELELLDLLRRYGHGGAKKLWGLAESGVNMIVNNIKKLNIECDLQIQDSLFVGIGKSGEKDIKSEVEARKKFGFMSKHYNSEKIKSINSGIGYSSAVQYSGTYGINPLLYSQAIKNVLLKKAVKIYESSEVETITGNIAKTHLGSVTAKKIIVCIDKMTPEFNKVSENTYHAQTFLSITEPLSDIDIKTIFPKKDMMCWDSKLVYSYYRLTGDKRLLLGGGTAMTTFSPLDIPSPRVIKKVIKEFLKRFPTLDHIKFIQYWPGRIDTTKDLIPIVDYDPTNKDIQYVLGCVGLPWATFCGDYAAKRALDPKLKDEYHELLKLKREFLIPTGPIQKILGKMLTFSLNNGYSKYIQKDKN